MSLPPSVFRNKRFASNTSVHRSLVTAGTEPIVFALTSVMIFILVMVLLDMRIEWMVKYGTSTALFGALCWTFFQLARTPAEVAFKDGRVRIRNALDIHSKGKKNDGKWCYVIDVECNPRLIRITAGHTSYEFSREDWQEFASLADCLVASKNAFDLLASPS